MAKSIVSKDLVARYFPASKEAGDIKAHEKSKEAFLSHWKWALGVITVLALAAIGSCAYLIASHAVNLYSFAESGMLTVVLLSYAGFLAYRSRHVQRGVVSRDQAIAQEKRGDVSLLETVATHTNRDSMVNLLKNCDTSQLSLFAKEVLIGMRSSSKTPERLKNMLQCIFDPAIFKRLEGDQKKELLKKGLALAPITDEQRGELLSQQDEEVFNSMVNHGDMGCWKVLIFPYFQRVLSYNPVKAWEFLCFGKEEGGLSEQQIKDVLTSLSDDEWGVHRLLLALNNKYIVTPNLTPQEVEILKIILQCQEKHHAVSWTSFTGEFFSYCSQFWSSRDAFFSYCAQLHNTSITF